MELGFEPRSLLTTKPKLLPLLSTPCFLWEQVVKILRHRKGAGGLGKEPRSRVRAAGVACSCLPHGPGVLPQQSAVAFTFMLQGWPRAHWRVMTSLWY